MLIKRFRAIQLFVLVVAFAAAGVAQNQPGSAGGFKPVMWERVQISKRDLFAGPGGANMKPDLSRIELIKEEKGGHNKKYRIKDGSGRIWVAKLGREAKPETAAVRLMWGLGYKTEINYLVPTITIPEKGTFQNVRLEARPDNVERLDEWEWEDNPFVGTRELQGLKMMMVFMSNWDVLDLQNQILEVGGEHHYIVSDLGSTFGKLGNNNLPIFYRLGRKVGSPKHFANTKFVKEVDDEELKVAYKGKNRKLFKGFTVGQGRWLLGLLNQLSDKQISDAFRAGGYSRADVSTYVNTVKRKIRELDDAVGGQYAGNYR